MGKRRARIIGVPMDLGAGHRGVDMGPFSVRIAGITPKIRGIGFEVEDDGNVPVKIQEQMDVGDPRLRFLPQIAEVCREVAEWVEEAVDAGDLPIVIGGDHSIAMGSLSGLAGSYRKRGLKLGLIWFDAHADFNTPDTTASGNIHGMPFAVLMGQGAPDLTSIGGFSPKFEPSNVALIGVRSIDPSEREIVKRSGIAVYTMREVDERGLPVIMREALERATNGTDGFAASVDMDCFDPSWSPGVGTPVTGGLSYREAHFAMEMIADTGALRHLDIVEINPIFDHLNRTSEMGVELVLSALGKRIL